MRGTVPEPLGSVVLTYAELGERLGIGPDSARMRAKRKGWATVPGNDGRTRVRVPPNELPEHPPERHEREAGEQGAQLAELGAKLAEERARAEGAQLEAAELRVTVARLEERLAADERRENELRTGFARERATLEERIADSAASLMAERSRADRLEAALAEARRPWLVRLLEGLRRKGS